MASSLVVRRIDAWEAAGLIDPETAERLRGAEADAGPEPEAAEARAPGVGRAVGITAVGITAVELFVYLGAAFVLGAWYALVASTSPSWEDSSARFAAAGLVAAIALALMGVAMAGRDARFRRAAGVAFLAALPNLGAGVYLLADTLHPDVYPAPPTNALVASIVVLVAALAARRLVPALTTQLGLAVSVATAGAFAMRWLDAVLLPRGGQEWDPRPIDETAALVRVVLSMAWWWAVAAVMALLLVILDPRPRTEGRTRLGRVAVGLTAVLGTTSAVFIRHDWSERLNPLRPARPGTVRRRGDHPGRERRAPRARREAPIVRLPVARRPGRVHRADLAERRVPGGRLGVVDRPPGGGGGPVRGRVRGQPGGQAAATRRAGGAGGVGGGRNER